MASGVFGSGGSGTEAPSPVAAVPRRCSFWGCRGASVSIGRGGRGLRRGWWDRVVGQHRTAIAWACRSADGSSAEGLVHSNRDPRISGS